MEIPDVQSELKLQMPAWNALYEIRDFSSHVQQVEAYRRWQARRYRKTRQAHLGRQSLRHHHCKIRHLLGRFRSFQLPTQLRSRLYQSRDDPAIRPRPPRGRMHAFSLRNVPAGLESRLRTQLATLMSERQRSFASDFRSIFRCSHRRSHRNFQLRRIHHPRPHSTRPRRHPRR